MTSTTIRKSYGNRKLYSFPEDYPFRAPRQKQSSAPKKSEDVAKIIKYIDDNVIGKNNAFLGPFGRRKVVLCDYVSSGRSLQFIEEYILKEVLPCYGNTHSTTNVTSIQSTLFRQEAREIIRTAVNASEEDAVIFAGHGCSGALEKLIKAMDFREPPIVFTAPFEHQDNLQLWQETGAAIIRIAETKDGFLDLNDLEEQLRLHQNKGRQLIGCFSVASNVTGIVTDDIASTLLLHQYGALAFWDYNVAAPGVNVDVNPFVPGFEEGAVQKDAVYFSGHKFVGGVQTPGILVAKKALFKLTGVCEAAGFFIPQEQKKSFELQEEGSAAAVVESIRAGLVMQLKDTITTAYIQQRQEKITKQMLQHIRTTPEIILLGNGSSSLKRIPIFSFMVRHPRGTFLHHNFVCAILNDVFGIQARSGCPCSGPYAQDLLGIDQSLADQYENIILEDRRLSSLNLCTENSLLELLRPGFTRISLPYFINDAELAFIMEAVKMVATEGWKLLPQYIVDLNTGEWRHHTNATSKDRKWISSIRYVDGKMTLSERRISGPGPFPQNYSECLQTARNLFNRSRKTANRHPYADQGITFDSRAEKLRWFMLQQEAQDLLTSNSQNVKHSVPFDPTTYLGSKRNEHKNKTDKSLKVVTSGPSSPRHYSLPAIDDARVLRCSSPVPYFVQDVNTLYYTTPYNQTQQVSFAVGESVNSANLSPMQHNLFRERCFSLGAPNISPPILSPQTRVSLGMHNFRQRNYSHSSEQQSLDSDLNTSPTQSLNFLSASTVDCSQMGRASPAPDLQTYVTEMTKELATNIKSEIRGVINTVEDVLENTDAVDTRYMERQGSGSDDGRSDSISANEVAEYLEKVSIEMANEVKSEIRDVVSAVDVFITPECQEKYSYSRTSSSGDSDKSAYNRPYSDKYTPGSSSETVIHLIGKSHSNNKLTDEERTSQDKIHRHKVLQSNVTSVSSQDSGINLSFQEHDSDFAKRRCSSESLGNRPKEPDFSDRRKKGEIVEMESLGQISEKKWACPPKNFWQAVVEAIQEYQMIKNGDKVLVCLSGGKDSLSLLHILLHYQSHAQNKGIVFSLGAITLNPESTGADLSLLIAHVRSLGVHYIIENFEDLETNNRDENIYSFSTKQLRHAIYKASKNSGYNLIAVGQHLDDVCESFLLSVFHSGSLRAMKAHYHLREHGLRVIRPLVYVREKLIRQFASLHNLPALLASSVPEMTKERQRMKQLLAQQEILFPKLFFNLRSSVQPLVGFHNSGYAAKNRKRLRSKGNDDLCDQETDEEPVCMTDN